MSSSNLLLLRSRCGPRLEENAAEKLKNKYVLMRNSNREIEEEGEKDAEFIDRLVEVFGCAGAAGALAMALGLSAAVAAASVEMRSCSMVWV